MVPESHRPSVLIVDPDAAIRVLAEAVLKHAGFCTISAVDFDTAAAQFDISSFAVIVRDLNLASAASRRSLKPLTSTEPGLLRRTIVITTAAARAAAAVRAGTVFAIISKPFDVEELVEAVVACAGGSRDAKRPSPDEPARQESKNLESLQRFVRNVPSLHDLLSVEASSEREAALRVQMRRTLGALSATLREAADVEASRTRAAVLRAASTVASRLAAVPAPALIELLARRDH